MSQKNYSTQMYQTDQGQQFLCSDCVGGALAAGEQITHTGNGWQLARCERCGCAQRYQTTKDRRKLKQQLDFQIVERENDSVDAWLKECGL